MRRIFPLAIVLAAAGCDRRPPPLPQLDAAVYKDSIDAFHARRKTAIYGPEGWATLVGLWWLKPGENKVGAAADNGVVLLTPNAAKYIGSIFVEGDSTRFVAAKDIKATVDSVGPVTNVRLVSDLDAKDTRLHIGPLLFQHVVRNNLPGIRIKDSLNPVRMNHHELEYFPADTAFRISAHFMPRSSPDSLDIVSVLGMVTRMVIPGDLHFDHAGKSYSLTLIREPEDHSKNMFVMFRDQTNGKETYPAMRYTYVPPPDSLGRTILDFNKSYNPPCAFTTSATCPLPPRGNELPFRVTAGELKPPGHP